MRWMLRIALVMILVGLIGIAVTASASNRAGEQTAFKSLRVGGVRLIYLEDEEDEIRPFNYPKGHTLVLVGQLPFAATMVVEGQLEKAITDTGEDLAPKQEWERKIHWPKLTKDQTAVVFEVGMTVPSDKAKYFKEVSGTIQVMVANGSKKIDLGITDFNAGATGQEFAATITSVKPSDWQEGRETLSLQFNLAKDAIKSVMFYDAAGKEFKADRSSTSWAGEQTTMAFSVAPKFPASGKIVVEVYDQVEHHTKPFQLKDISLAGRPMH